MTPELLVGVDIGTTACKAAVVDLDGSELAHASAPTPWRRVPTGAEIDPELFVEAVVNAAGEALSAAGQGRVVSLGIASIAETGVLLDGAGGVVAPSIAWHDVRGGAEIQAVADAVGRSSFVATTGLGPRPLRSAAKYCWLRGHHPGAERGRRWLNVAEWVVFRLGGEQVSELSLSSRTGWLDMRVARPWQAALDACEAPHGLVPEPTVAGTPAGAVRSGPERLRGAVLTVAGHDHLCGAVGAGALDEGDVYDSCGTAEAFIATLPPPLSDADVAGLVEAGVTVGRHVTSGRLALLGALWAGLGLQRFLDLLGVGPDQRPALDAAALAAAPGADLAVDDVEDERATLRGIGHGTSPAQVWRAALEAVGRRSREVLDEVERVAGPTQRLVVAGGWSRSPAFQSVKRSSLGPFVLPSVEEAGARGAALFGGMAAGRFPSVAALPRPPLLDAPASPGRASGAGHRRHPPTEPGSRPEGPRQQEAP